MYELFEAIRSSGKTRKPYDPRPWVIPAALSAVEDFYRFTHLAWPWGRGSSKTTTGSELHAAVATMFPNCATVYFSDTIRRAVQTAWPDFRAIGIRAGGKANDSDHTVYYPNGSRSILTGMDHLREFDRNKGIKRIAFVHADECQDQISEFLHYAITRVFGPRMGDLEAEAGWIARFLLSGTGGKDAGYWWEACTKPTTHWRVSHLTQWDNPYIVNPDRALRQVCKDSHPPIEVVDLENDRWVPAHHKPRKVDTSDPEIRREFFAEFNAGGKLQIFHITRASLCPRTDVPSVDVEIVIGTDFGTVHKWAGACWVYSKWSRVPVLARWDEKHGMSSSRQVQATREFTDRCIAEFRPIGPPHVEGDGGGLGKALIIDIQEAEGAWEVNPARKDDKVPNMRILSGDLECGAAQVVDDQKQLIAYFREPEYHPDHIGDKIRGHVPDPIDAAHYGYRKVKEFHTYEERKAKRDELERERQREREIQRRMRREPDEEDE